MTNTTVIVAYGLPGAGKSTIISIADEFEIPSIVMGDLVRERAREDISKPLTSESLVDSRFTDRLNRLQDRDRDGEGEFTPTDLKTRDVRELKWGLGNLFAVDTPNHHVENTTSLDEFQQQTRNAFREIASQEDM